MSRRGLYRFLGLLSFAGYIWLAWNGTGLSSRLPVPGLCMFKALTHLPCPSCGATRAILLLLNGYIAESLFLNPLGVFLFLALVLIPLWLAADLLMKKESLYRCYMGMERSFRQRAWLSIPLILLVVVNWVWNILKKL